MSAVEITDALVLEIEQQSVSLCVPELCQYRHGRPHGVFAAAIKAAERLTAAQSGW